MRERAMPLIAIGLALAACVAACGERLSLGDAPLADRVVDASVGEPPDAGFLDADRDALLASDAVAPHVACEGKACGEACTICRPGDTACVESADPKTCDLLGGCLEGTVACGDGGWQPCIGKTCNDLCEPCDPQDPNCIVAGVVFVCSPVGKCVYLTASGC